MTPKIKTPCASSELHRAQLQSAFGNQSRRLLALAILVALRIGQAQTSTSFHAGLDRRTTPEEAAKFLWSSALTQCGDSFFFMQQFGPAAEPILFEFKGPFKYPIEIETLSRADQLNGLQARARSYFRPDVSRMRNAKTRSWTKWEQGSYAGTFDSFMTSMLNTFDVTMTRKSGHWELTGPFSGSFTDEMIANKISCAAATKDAETAMPVKINYVICNHEPDTAPVRDPRADLTGRDVPYYQHPTDHEAYMGTLPAQRPVRAIEISGSFTRIKMLNSDGSVDDFGSWWVSSKNLCAK